MFVDHYGQRPPRLSGESSSKKVAQGVIRAIKRDTVEVFVTARPTRLFLALYTLWPGLGNAFLKWVGVMDLFRRAAEKQR